MTNTVRSSSQQTSFSVFFQKTSLRRTPMAQIILFSVFLIATIGIPSSANLKLRIRGVSIEHFDAPSSIWWVVSRHHRYLNISAWISLFLVGLRPSRGRVQIMQKVEQVENQNESIRCQNFRSGNFDLQLTARSRGPVATTRRGI
ncbi:hypothetical protein QR685DRAFT_334752 [Neurospora intermedia]|uniref:Uncharacterized protein n=1 Tax=Neurospora intermedia TaxID=5142 RepID=A0ABR3D6A0_NEUIN